jgi:hypothetical protein
MVADVVEVARRAVSRITKFSDSIDDSEAGRASAGILNAEMPASWWRGAKGLSKDNASTNKDT